MKTFISKDMTNEDYHGHSGSFSSSNLKKALLGIEVFYKDCILNEGEKEHIAAFDTGTYFHTKVLEPHLLNDECAVYDGVRRGEKWDKFKKENVGKAILTKSQAATANKLAELVEESAIANELIEKCEPEISCFVEVIVNPDKRKIYTSDLTGEFTLDGFRVLDFDDQPLVDENSVKLVLKVRADAICVDEGFVLDLKSTTGDTKNPESVKKKISRYEYDLSASMYLDLFSAGYGKTFDKFYWTFASKDKHNCKTYVASELNVKVGRAKWHKAVFTIAEGYQTDFEFVESIAILEPEVWQKLEWLEEKKK